MHKEKYEILETIFKDKNFYEIYKILKKTKSHESIDERLKFVQIKNRDFHDEPTLNQGATYNQDCTDISNSRIFKISKHLNNKENLDNSPNTVARNLHFSKNNYSENSLKNSFCTLQERGSTPLLDRNFMASFYNSSPNFNFNTKQNVNYLNFNINQPPFLSWNVPEYLNNVNQLQSLTNIGVMQNFNYQFQPYTNMVNPQIMSMLMTQFGKNNELQILSQILNNCNNTF
jgi:hypothetical protein